MTNEQSSPAVAEQVERRVVLDKPVLGAVRSNGVGTGNWINDMLGGSAVFQKCNKCGGMYWGYKRRKECRNCTA